MSSLLMSVLPVPESSVAVTEAILIFACAGDVVVAKCTRFLSSLVNYIALLRVAQIKRPALILR